MRVAESIIAASKICILQNINNSEKARMSHNLGRQAHWSQRGTAHRKLDNDIVDTRSLLDISSQTTKDLKAQLKELTDKKKEAGKTPRNSQAASNKFNVPIPKIGAGSLSATTDVAFELAPSSAPNSDVEKQEIQPIDVPIVNYAMAPTVPTHHDDFSAFQPLSPVPGVLGLLSEIGTHYDSEDARYHPGFDLPPLDLDLFNLMLENEQVPEPTAEEIAAYQFLKYSLGK